jgi:hypothetical protein
MIFGVLGMLRSTRIHIICFFNDSLCQGDGNGRSPTCPTTVCIADSDLSLRCFTKLSEPWKSRRQAFHDALPPSSTSRLELEMMHNTVEMLAKIIEKPEQTLIHFVECGLPTRFIYAKPLNTVVEFLETS